MNNECLIQGSDKWKDSRKMHITSTDASIICGSNPFCTPYKLWLTKMDLIPEEEVNQKMIRGTLLEPIAREWLEKEHNIRCSPKVLFKDFAMASLDGISECGNFIVEIKCGEKAFSSAYEGNIPRYYLDQIFHQMYVSDVQLAYYVAFNGETGIIIPVKRDQEFINNMIEKEREFYQCLISFTPPTMTTKDYQMRSDPSWKVLAENYRNAYLDRKRAEQLEESLRQELILLSGGQSSMGSGIKLSKITKRGMINYSEIPALQELDLEEYRKKPSEYWKIFVDLID